ncbi:MAG: glyoxylase-like metal-dependent hydrolase (beta-lactamase superfamily II) [Arenicella sp.]|jgi:glyoxylase-like metal-dependent hydrolase (beta-lactamase superfamily II)
MIMEIHVYKKLTPNSTIGVLKVVFYLCLLFALPSFAVQTDPAASMAGFCKKLPRADYQSLSQIPVASNWFEVYEVAPGVSAIYEPHQWQEVISYLIEGEQQALLFDTGNGIADIGKVVAALTDKPVAVLNSHTHYDHVGGNFAFAKVYGMDTEFTRAQQSGHPNQDIAIEASKQALCRQLPDGVTQQNHVGRPFKVTDFIQDGDQIDLGGRQLDVLHVPGHTPDAIALIDRAAGLMWTGDSYYSGPIWLFAPETDLDAYAKSLQRLIISAKGLKALLPAHNTPWVSPDVLPRVAQGLQTMLDGNTKAVPQGDAMVEHQIEGESEFSFLMRDEAIPYK